MIPATWFGVVAVTPATGFGVAGVTLAAWKISALEFPITLYVSTAVSSVTWWLLLF